MTSAPLRVPSARQTFKATLFLTKCTEPSPSRRLTPPLWLLVGGDWNDSLTIAVSPGIIMPAIPEHDVLPGGPTWL